MEYRLGMPKILTYCGFKTTQDYFDDEDELEDKLLDELKQVRKVEEDAKMEKDLAYKLKQEEIRQKVQADKDELKRLGIKNNWFGTPEVRPRRLESSLPVLVCAAEDDEFSFMPKELESTMPTLVVSEQVKELERNVDALHIGSDIDKLTGSDLEAQVRFILLIRFSC